MSQPWMKFYPADWRADPALRMCSVSARGLWMELLCLMHEAEPRGSLLINGKTVSDRQIASLCGVPLKEANALLAELEDAGVFSREDNGTVYSRRMRRDEQKSAKDKANGRLGGNPKVKGGVNPPSNPEDKAQKPEARKNSEANTSGAEAPPDPSIERRALFDRGKEVLGPKAGGVITDLLKAKGGNVPLARAAIEQASQAQNAAEYIGRINRPRPGVPNDEKSVHRAADRLVERIANSDWLQPSDRSRGSPQDVRLLAQGRRL